MGVDDQASRLRKLMRQSRQTRTIAICSGKGGVGKSNISLNLAVLLSAGGNSVALVDADLGLANLDVLTGAKVRGNLSHVIAGTRRLDEVIIDLPCGVQLIPGASGLAKLASLSEFQRANLMGELATLEADNQIIVIDCGAGIGPNVLHFAASADIALIVTTPEPTAITDGYAIVKLLAQRSYAGHMSLLSNMVADRQEARTTYQRISTVARGFLDVHLFDAGYVLMDPKLREAVRRRQPLVLAYPRSPASRCLAALATKIFSAGAFTSHGEGFFRRVVNWFA